MRRQLITALVFCMLTATSISSANAAEPEAARDLSKVKLLGLQLSSADLNVVRKHLWDIGGFQQARSTVRQRNIDKFFTWSRIRDSYYVEFRYNNAGNITSVRRLFRPYSIENSNRRSAISTRDVALELIPEIGQPMQVEKKGWGGTMTYSSYRWEDDNIKVVVDREGGESLGNVFVEYTVKTQSPYEVAQIGQN